LEEKEPWSPVNYPEASAPPPVVLRMTRAREHVASLEDLLRRYADKPPYRVSTRPGEHLPLKIDRADLVEDPPVEAPMLVSEAVHHARAALDNLVNALRPAGPAPGVFFPIQATEAGYDKAIRGGAMDAVPDWAREVIRALRSFMSADSRGWAGDQLPNWHHLARIDRHRVPPIHAAIVLPDYATSDGAGAPAARVNLTERRAEWQYDPDHVGSRAFRVEVLFGEEATQHEGVQVADWTHLLVDRTGYAIWMIMNHAPTSAGHDTLS
jgi:hypothetical protein